MIARVWHGWASTSNADAYQEHFETEVLGHLRQIDGFGAAQLWHRNEQGQVEFVAVTTFESLDAVRAFAGPDYERAFVAPQARSVLTRFDQRCRHFGLAVSSSGIEEPRRIE